MPQPKTTESVHYSSEPVPRTRSVNSFFLDASRGLLSSTQAIHIFGQNRDVGTSEEDIWGQGGTYPFPVTAETVRVKAGGNAADDASGAGARTILITGLNQNWVETTETLTLAGASASSASTTTFYRIRSAQVMTSGTYGAANTGNITIENTSSNQVLALILAGFGTSANSMYTVPAGKKAYLMRVDFHVESNKATEVRFYYRQNADNFSTYSSKKILTIVGSFVGQHSNVYTVNKEFTAKTDIWIAAISTPGAATVSCHYDLIIMDA